MLQYRYVALVRACEADMNCLLPRMCASLLSWSFFWGGGGGGIKTKYQSPLVSRKIRAHDPPNASHSQLMNIYPPPRGHLFLLVYP